jgi:hypothetical protein
MCGLVPSDKPILLTRLDEEYFIHTEGNSSLNFKFPFLKDEALLTNPPVRPTLIIDGRKITPIKRFEEIRPGLEFKCETIYTHFLIVVKLDSITSDRKYVLKVTSSADILKNKK